MQIQKPFDANSLVEYGFLKKTNGIAGELILCPNDGFNETTSIPEFLFFEIEGLPVPYFVESFKWRADDNCMLKFRYIDSKEEAQKFLGCKVFAEFALQNAESDFNPYFLKGYFLFDQNDKQVGQIEVINDYGGNLVLSLMANNEEILIPFHPELLIDVDQEKKQVTLLIAEGLY